MIKRKKASVVIGIFFGVMWIIWVFVLNNRVISQEYAIVEKKYDNIGEWVSCGDNYYGKTYMNGIEVRIKSAEYYQWEEYLQKLRAMGYSEENTDYRGPVYEVALDMRNTGSWDVQVGFLAMYLTGRDFCTTPWTEWCQVINGFDEGSIGVQLGPGKEIALKISYILSERMYREKMGRKLKEEPLWIMLTAYPERILARVQ